MPTLKVRRVQKLIETLDVLKLQIAKPSRAMESKVHDLRRENPNFDKPRTGQQPINRGNFAAPKPVFQRPLMKRSESVVVTTKWETFD